ncbi:MAG TPA: hypothetical protein VLG12_04775 [Candidatus Saccharimonadales bacterium]|nr:hypothetical protein [Candidatus Saccharimonadales bacterium]
MKKSLIFFTTCYVLLATYYKPAFADTNCQSVYGGGQSCGSGNITVQKQVLRPGTSNEYVDSLRYNDTKYQPASPIFFKITITNTTKNTLKNIVVNDTVDTQHEFLNFVSAPGSFNNSTKILTYKIPSLVPGQQSTLTMAGKILDAQSLPKQAVICAGNTVQVSVDNGSPASAISAFCIQNTSVQPVQPTATPTQVPVQNQTTKGGLPIAQTIPPTATPTPSTSSGPSAQKPAPKQTNNFPVYTAANNMTRTPKSGPEELPLLAMIPAGGIGLWLRKKSK